MAGVQTFKVQIASTAGWLDADKPDVSFECLNIGSLARKLKLGLIPSLQHIGVWGSSIVSTVQ